VRSRHRESSRFGPRRDPFTGRLRQHNGFDFAAPTGTPIYASATGRVIMAGTLGAYGKMIKIRHDFGYDTLYAHLHRIRVDRGDIVERGDLIGDMGSTGRSTGPHLHYEIHKDGRPVDPINYLRAARDVL
ncbi:MAG: M23 family metallopeptidase, partial [Pseudomonadota bacterium]